MHQNVFRTNKIFYFGCTVKVRERSCRFWGLNFRPVISLGVRKIISNEHPCIASTIVHVIRARQTGQFWRIASEHQRDSLKISLQQQLKSLYTCPSCELID